MQRHASERRDALTTRPDGKAKALDDPEPISMAQRLKAFRTKNSASITLPSRHGQEVADRFHVPELDLLRDILYILQGINGTYVTFVDSEEARRKPPRFDDEGELLPEPLLKVSDTQGVITQSTIDLLHRLAELGFLFRQIDQGLKSRAAGESRGLIEQSLANALENELTAYFHLIALLESRLGSAAGPSDFEMSEELQKLDDDRGLTLLRLAVYTNDVKLRLRFASVMVASCSTEHGGALVSEIYKYTSHGDPFIRSFTDALLDEVSKPFFATMERWMHQGELNDPYKEFFVALNEQFRGRDGLNGFMAGHEIDEDEEEGNQLAHTTWDRKFIFQEDMRPAFVAERFARKIFSTGKSLNFLKYSCGDAEWVSARAQTSAGQELAYSDLAGLEHSIDSAYAIASQRLFDVFFDRFHLLDHLRALKDYLMLGKGDFVDVLMEQMAPSLSRPAESLFQHNLTATLETAIRGSTSVSDHEDVLRRLDARMQEFSPDHLGWDAFTLEYRVDSPLDTVLDPATMREYLGVFNQLWRMKRVEVAVTEAWQRIVTGAKIFSRVKELHSVFHSARIDLAAMTHFIRSLQTFCHLDVIESRWSILEEACLKKQGDLDALLTTHRDYLLSISQRILLLQPNGSKPEALLERVRDIFRLILLYQGIIDSLCNDTLQYAADEVSKKDLERGIKATHIPSAIDVQKLDGHRQRLETTAQEYRRAVESFCTTLAVHQIIDLRSLSTLINFNFGVLSREVKSRRK